jgi:hypothetical protein
MRNRRRQSGIFLRNRLFWQRPALLLLIALFSHAFDACASHIGALPMFTGEHSHTNTLCVPVVQTEGEVCSQTKEHHADLCDVVSETATRQDAPHILKAPPMVLVEWFVVPVLDELLEAPASAIRSRDGPDVEPLTSQFARQTLAGRAPPLSA